MNRLPLLFCFSVLFLWMGISCSGPSCPEGQSYCGNKCIDVTGDSKNCGHCGSACPQGLRCVDRACVFCPLELPSLCGESCVNVLRDEKNCGDCGKACKKGWLCEVGECRCPNGFTDCGGNCIDLLTAPKHCGKCGQTCSGKQSCYLGVCIEEDCKNKQPPLTKCGNACVSTTQNPLHCGACDTTCRKDQICLKGKCVCGPEQKVCNGVCAHLATDWKHCGGCGKACKRGQFCAAGKCVPSCPKSTPTQCYGGCFDTLGSIEHCGRCGNTCQGLKTCQSGECRCPAGYTDCSGRCVLLQSSHLHCGKCGQACPKGELCASGKCIKKCPTKAPTLCAFGCFDTSQSDEHCGKCGVRCTGGSRCQSGRCSCLSGQALCEGRCVDTKSSHKHCDGCGKTCKGNEVCVKGSCQQRCPDAQPTLCGGGCVDLSRDVHNCGACGRQCSTGALCCVGSCKARCIPVTGENPVIPEKELPGPREKVEEVIPDGGGEESIFEGSPEIPENDKCDNDSRKGQSCFAQQAKGACQKGVLICQNNRLFCLPGNPGKEVCDKIDNDCNGQVDESNVCCLSDPQYKQPCVLPNKKGLCASGEKRCQAGKLTCTALQPTPLTETCDGKDNDCDGLVDEEGICGWVHFAYHAVRAKSAVDSKGNAYIITSYQPNVTITSSSGQTAEKPPSAPKPRNWVSSILVAKFSSKGALLWRKSYVGIDMYGTAIALDPKDNLFITGRFANGIYIKGKVHERLGPGVHNRCFTARLDPSSGAVIWAKVFDLKDFSGSFHALHLSAIGRLFIGGWFNGKLQEGKISVVSGPNRATGLVAELDPKDGAIKWAKKVDATSTSSISDIVSDASGHIYTFGNFAGELNTKTSKYKSKGFHDLFVAKIDKSGNPVWFSTTGSSGGEYIEGLGIDKSGNLYISGGFAGGAKTGTTITFGKTTLTTKGKLDLYVASLLSKDGTFRWAVSVGGTGFDNAADLTVQELPNKKESIFITGRISAPDLVTFGKLSPVRSKGAEEIFIAQLDTNGTFLKVKLAGGNGEDYGSSISVTRQGEVYCSGYSHFTTTFEGKTYTGNLRRGFLWKAAW